MIKFLLLALLSLGFCSSASAVTYEYSKGTFNYNGDTFCPAGGCTSVAQVCALDAARLSMPTDANGNSKTITCASSTEFSPWTYKFSCSRTGTATAYACSNAHSGATAFSGISGSTCVLPWVRNTVVAASNWDSLQYCKKEVDVPTPGTCAIGAPGSAGSYDVTTGYATGASSGSGVASKVVPDGGWPNVTFCDGVCTIKTSGNPDSCHIESTPGANGYYKMYCTGGFENTGSQCTIGPGNPDPSAQTPEPSTPNSSPDGKCPAGSVASGQDSFGMTICVGTAKPPTPPTTTTDKPPVTTQNPDGGSTTVRESTRTNADGTTTTTTTTTVTAPDGSTSTTVSQSTSTKPDGSNGTEDKPEDKSDLCKQNPHLTICKNSQVMGTCGQVTCSGDAIQCATLRAAAAMECKQRKDQEEVAALPATSLGAAIAAGADPMKEQIDAALAGTTVDLSSPNLDQNGFIGGGSCFPSKTMHFGSQAITVDFSSICEDIQPLRYAVLAVSLIIAYLIVSKSILGA